MSWIDGLFGGGGNGQLIGTGIGAIAGSIIPGVGTMLGAGIGGALGGVIQSQSDANTGRDLFNQAQTARTDANAANDFRYNQALGLQHGLGDTLRALNAQYSAQNVLDINRSFDEQQARSNASLAGRGLLGTTIAPSLDQGFARERAAALNRENDSRLARASGIEEGTTRGLVNTITGRSDVGPSFADLGALAAATGRNQAGVTSNLNSLLAQVGPLFGQQPRQTGWYSRNLPQWPTSFS